MRVGVIGLLCLAAAGCPGGDAGVSVGDTVDTALGEDVAQDTLSVDDTVAGDGAGEDVAADTSADTVEADTGPLADTTADAGSTRCDPALTLGPSAAYVFPYGDLDLVPAGGTGAYRFALVDDGTGALLHRLTGAYLAGGTPGVDRVRLTDVGCVGEASVTVHVVEPMEVAPAVAVVPPGTSLTLSVIAGSGHLDFALTADASGASLDAVGRYQAGQAEGVDVVTVVDVSTGQVETSEITVRAGATPRPEPGWIGVPVGETYAPAIAGGSGAFELVGDDAGLEATDGVWRVTAPGPHEGRVIDVFTGQEVVQRVVGLAPLGLDVARTGTSTFAFGAVGPGDLDGDGYRDAVVGIGEANVSRYQSGGVYVYCGGADGLDPEPAQIIAGAEREDDLGRSLAVADLDGDGELDLAAGARRADTAPQGDDGAVYVYPGVVGGLFAEAPAAVLDGPNGSDQLGFSVTACDFNADGVADLASGAWIGEDRARSPLLDNQGAVHVWLGEAGSFPAGEPDQTVYGLAPDGDGAWSGVANGRAGSALAAGDLDGDGVCDLVVGGYTYDNGAANDGFVLVYRGLAASGGDPGGLDPIPARAFAGVTHGGSHLGWRLATGDVDGDAIDDLLVGQAWWNHGAGNDRWGAARLFLGGDAFAGPAVAFEPPDVADWSVTGTKGSDYLGYGVAIGEVTGAPPADLVVGVWIGECAGCPNDGGRLDVYAGVDGSLPGAEPVRVMAGAAPGDRVGSAVAVLGDVEGDGPIELLGVAGLDDTLGDDVPRPWVGSVSADDNATVDELLALESPGEPGGWRIGAAVAPLGDLDGDGVAELAVSAPNESVQRESGGHFLVGGAVHVYSGAAPEAPAQTLAAFPGHSGFDWLGYDLARLPDFDGDGVVDLAVLARYEDRPANFAAGSFASEAGCPSASVNNGGGVYVFAGAPAGGGLEPTPAFVYYGDQRDDTLERVVGADIDGDGRTDLVAASRLFDASGRGNAGGFTVVPGRARLDPARTTVACAGTYSWTGAAANDQAGSALAALGDVDGDGCDDFALGAWLEDLGGSNRGAVRVVLGWGASCARAEPAAFTLTADTNDDRIGASLASADVDGDGLSELLVGGTFHRRDGVRVGGTWLLDGRRLAALAATAVPLADGGAPAQAALGGAAFTLEGQVEDEGFGTVVALGPGLVVVGSAASDVTGAPGVSVVRVYTVTVDGDGALSGVDPAPAAVLAGETGHPGALREGALALHGSAEGPVLVIGAAWSRALALDSGAVYAVPLDLSPTGGASP